MKILFTGSSSFTGYWFIKELCHAGHEVIATFKGNRDSYKEVRNKRVEELTLICECVFNCEFGGDDFIRLIEKEPNIDVFCHHYADATNYRSEDFDVLSALNSNTINIARVLKALREKDCNKILLTGSVFEYNEGAGSDDLRAFSPYGLSKGITAEIFKYYSEKLGMRLCKFVIPNPFGPYEEPRFTSYLVKMWYAGQVPTIMTPDYVRDNIPVSLLAKAYVFFAANHENKSSLQIYRPSGFVESQGAFALRFAKEIGSRLGMPCEIKSAVQETFSEPIIRINTDYVKNKFPDWNEDKSWNELAMYYKMTYGDNRE